MLHLSPSTGIEEEKNKALRCETMKGGLSSFSVDWACPFHIRLYNIKWDRSEDQSIKKNV